MTTPHSANPLRLEGLIEHGLDDEELQQFFKSSKTKLLLAGARVQRLPRNRVEATRLILRFTDKAHAVFAAWLQEHPSEYETSIRGELVARFRAIEDRSVHYSSEETLDLFRCGLDALYADAPPAEWLAYLSTDPNEPAEAGSKDLSSERGDDLQTPPTPRAIEEYALWISGALKHETISDPTLQLAARLAEAIRRGNAAVINDLPPDALGYPSLRELFATAALALSPRPSGIIATEPPIASFDTDKNYLSMEVIATANRNAGIGPYFLDVEAFVEGGKIYTLSSNDLRKVLPDEGRIIHFADPHVPAVVTGKPTCYRVERFDTTKAIKVRVISGGRQLLSIRSMPHPSADHDGVRQWIQTHAGTQTNNAAIFVTSDGLCVALRAEQFKRVLAADFDWLLDSWPAIEAVKLRSGPFVLAPLPASVAVYECAPLAIVARRLVKRFADEHQLKLTKQQLNDLGERLGGDDATLEEGRRARISAHIQALVQSDLGYEQLLWELMRSPAIRQDIESRKSEEAGKVSAAVLRERKSLENLVREKTALEHKLTELKDEVDAHAKEVRAAIRKAFTTAKAKESETLGALALWQTLLGSRSDVMLHNSEPLDQQSAPQEEPSPQCLTQTFAAGGQHLDDVLIASGFNEEAVARYRVTLETSTRLGIPLLLSGLGASALALQLARCLTTGKVLCIDVPVGLLAPALDASIFSSGSPHDAIVIRNANLSDLSVYGQCLLDCLANRLFEPSTASAPPVVIISSSSGAASLPWPDEIRLLTAKIDLSAPIHKGDSSATAPVPASEGLLQQKLRRRIEVAGEAHPQHTDSYKLLVKLVLGLPADDPF